MSAAVELGQGLTGRVEEVSMVLRLLRLRQPLSIMIGSTGWMTSG
ncbi:hypothetical protein A2U01_0089727, partial [Trifolium medium]|nr:hypothetical protein [Trifolium medium]